MAIENRAETLRNELEKNLMILKRNREKVSLEILKTKYASGYNALCTSIRQNASAYLKETVLDGIRIREAYATEGISLIQNSIDESGFLKHLSKAAFHNHDINEFDTLALKLREQVLSDLEDFYYKHLGLYISVRCLQEPYPAPEIYCLVNNCILQDGKWIPLEDFQKTEGTTNSGISSARQQISA